jgi:hypothetical protein
MRSKEDITCPPLREVRRVIALRMDALDFFAAMFTPLIPPQGDT